MSPDGNSTTSLIRLCDRPLVSVKLVKRFPSYLLRPSHVAIHKNPFESWKILRTELFTNPSFTVYVLKIPCCAETVALISCRNMSSDMEATRLNSCLRMEFYPCT